ncbi:MAG: DUF4912 domain-containing protein [Pseudomonadota bacterium]
MASRKSTSKAKQKTSLPRAKAAQGAAAEKKKPASVRKKKQTASKIRLSPKDLRTISREISEAFPKAVDDTSSRLVLLDVDPQKLHAYWNIPLRQYTKALKKSGIAKMALRVYLLPAENVPLSKALHCCDVAIQGLRNQQYIDLQQDNALYAAECGLLEPDGTFVSLLRSNIVRTPPAGQSPDRSFATIDTSAVDKLAPAENYAAFPESRAAAKGAVPQPLAEPVSSLIRQALQEPASPSAGSMPVLHPFEIPKQDIFLDEMFIDGLIKQRLHIDTASLLNPESQQQPAGLFKDNAHMTVHAECFSSSSFYSPAGEQPSFTAELVIEGRVRPGVQLVRQGSKIPVSIDGRFQVRQHLPKDAGLLKRLAEMSPEEKRQAPSGSRISAMLTPGGSKKELQLEMYAFLHVYGNSINRTSIPFFSKEISVRPDGSFSFTHVLPEDALLLPELMLSIRPEEG